MHKRAVLLQLSICVIFEKDGVAAKGVLFKTEKRVWHAECVLVVDEQRKHNVCPYRQTKRRRGNKRTFINADSPAKLQTEGVAPRRNRFVKKSQMPSRHSPKENRGES